MAVARKLSLRVRQMTRLLEHPIFDALLHPDRWFNHPARWKLRKRLRSRLFAVARLHRRTLSRHQRVVMVVGSLGKTTATRAARATVGLPLDRWSEANYNHGVFLPLMLMRHSPFRRNVVVEAGIGHPGQMRDFALMVRPNVTVVTSVGLDHVVFFKGGIDQIQDEKAWAVRVLPSSGVAILNGDDPRVAWMATQTRARVVRFGLSPEFDVSASDIVLEWPRGMAFTLHARGECHRVRSRLLGRHMVSALLAGAAVGIVAGVAPATVARRLERVGPTPGRLDLFPLEGGITVLQDDYKATIDSVYSALATLAEAPGRRIAVMGGIDAVPKPVRAHSREVAEACARAADIVVLVDHREQRQTFRSGLRAGGFDFANLLQGATVYDAIAHLRAILRPGDVVLLKGHNAQKLGRIALALQGKDVRCRRVECRLEFQRCDDCPLLAKGPPPLAPQP